MTSTLNLKKKLQSWFNDHPEIQIAILYGSFANHRANEKSDIDLAIHIGRDLSDEERINYSQILAAITGRSVDLVDLSAAHGLILREVLASQEILLKKDTALYAKVLRRFLFEQADFGPLRERILAERRKRVLNN